MIKYVQLDKNNTKAFEGLASIDDLATVQIKERTYGIGAVDEKGVAIGVLIFSVTGDQRAIHHWIYVHPDFRGQGVGTELMHRFYDMISGLGLGEVTVSFLHNDSTAILRQFYEGFEYRFVKSMIYEVHTTLGELQKNPMFMKNPPPVISTIEKVSPADMKRFLNTIPKDMRERYFERSQGEIVEEVSSVFASGGKVIGAFIVEKRPSGKLVPLLFASMQKNMASLVGLLLRAMKGAKVKYNASTQVIIYCDRDEVGRLIDKLYPGFHPIMAWRGKYVFTS